MVHGMSINHVPTSSQDRRVAMIASVKYQLSVLRSLERILSSDEFIQYYSGQPDIESFIANRDLESIVYWMKCKRNETLEHRTVAELRKIAQRHSIKDYFLLTKVELIECLKQSMTS